MSIHHTEDELVIRTRRINFYEIIAGEHRGIVTRTFKREDAEAVKTALEKTHTLVEIVPMQAVVLPAFLSISNRGKLCGRIPRKLVPADVQGALSDS